MSGRRKPGLWHGPRRVSIEPVKRSHRRVCDECGDVPDRRRLVVVEGSGRGATTAVYCEVCGGRWIEYRAEEARRAARYLRTGKGAIRCE